MLQKSNTHWCHHSQGERGSWWQHTWQLAELLTARKLFGTERPDVFINLVHTKPLLQQSFENHFFFFFPNYDTPECGKTEMQNKKRVFDLKWEYIYICLHVYTNTCSAYADKHTELFTHGAASCSSKILTLSPRLSGVPVTGLKGNVQKEASSHRRSQPLP